LIGKLTDNRGLMSTEYSFNLLEYFLSDERLTTIGSQTAIEFHEHQYTYQDLRVEVSCWTAELTTRGVKEGDRVALLLYDSPQFIACFLAIVAKGAICVPINTFLNREEVQFILSDSGSSVVITEDELTDKIFESGSDNENRDSLFVLNIGESECAVFVYNREGLELNRSKIGDIHYTPIKESDLNPANNPINTDTPALILYTSGSTGTPKGALHSHGNVAATVEGFGESVLQLQSTDKIFSASRLFFAYGLGNSLSFPLAAGATVILENRRPSPQIISKIFIEHAPTVFLAVPAVYRALLDLHASGASVDTSSLRLCVSAGEALPATIFDEWQRTFGMTILDGIGSTEMLHMFISNREGAARAGSSGQVVAGYEAEILDDGGNQTPVGEQGNLWVKGSSAMAGYWRRKDLTEQVQRDGWLRTGDVYCQDKEGYYYHIGRSDDCFKVKGLWISPIEIESVLLGHPEVVEAAVVASVDENGLATAKAYLVIRKGSETLKKELYEFARARLATYKTPTQFEFVTEMPRTSTGKIQRFKLRA
jgi:benzoate-CoA ligase family protein